MPLSTDVTENRRSAAEIKFLIDADRAREIRDWARTHLCPDPNATEDGDAYRTTSLYFDTRNFDIFHRRGSFGRGKYRIRRYGDAEGVFLERKLRTRDWVSKRRSVVSAGDLPRLESEIHDDWPGYWFHRRLLARQLKPVCQIAYSRTARQLATPHGPIRLTLDQHIRALPLDGLLEFNSLREGMLVAHPQVILELKYTYRVPQLFKKLLAQYGLSPQPVSKYRLAAAALGLVTPGLVTPGLVTPAATLEGNADPTECLTA